MCRGNPRIAIVAALCVVSTPSLAGDMGARALARGGVGLADAGDAAGEAENLAAASLDPRYVVYAGAGLGADNALLLRAGALDSRTSVVALGAGYTRLTDDITPDDAELPGWKVPDEALSNAALWQRAHVGIAVPFLDRRISVAALGRVDWRSGVLLDEDFAFNFGFSAAGRPIEQLTLALGARNLLDTGFTRVTREADFAVRYTPGPRFGVEADVMAPLDAAFGIDRFAWRLGVDGGPLEWLALRGGWCMEAGTHFASAGVGLIHEKAVLDYGVRVQLDDPARNWHGLDLRVNF
jgi:hypothetical protein